MGKNKLQKFGEMETFPHVFQYMYSDLQKKGFELKGKWNIFFKNANPIVLELGCGRGEYTVALSELYPDKNFIGIDIKGARMWAGAQQSLQEGRTNVAFLRTSIELLNHFFAQGEVSEIWLTFPDPQMKKATKRLTSTYFMALYRQVLADNGIIHLKTDSPFMFTYTQEMVKLNHFPVLFCNNDIYGTDGGACKDAINRAPTDDKILSIKTYYEQQWLERGCSIKYIKFVLPGGVETGRAPSLQEPDIEIEHDAYRSFNRSKRTEQRLKTASLKE